MTFYNLTKQERTNLVQSIHRIIVSELTRGKMVNIITYFSDSDTYIRRAGYLCIGKIYFSNTRLQPKIIKMLKELLLHDDFKVRQTVINAAGEIGKVDFEKVQVFFDTGLFDQHHAARNAVIGSVKKMGAINPKPILNWVKKYLQHPAKEIRREICHGIELRGRKFPQDILPLLKMLQHDQTARVRNTLIHVLGQIAYKQGCLKTVVAHLKNWENKKLVHDALAEIIDVHHRYRNFSAMTQAQARQFIMNNKGDL